MTRERKCSKASVKHTAIPSQNLHPAMGETVHVSDVRNLQCTKRGASFKVVGSRNSVFTVLPGRRKNNHTSFYCMRQHCFIFAHINTGEWSSTSHAGVQPVQFCVTRWCSTCSVLRHTLVFNLFSSESHAGVHIVRGNV
jgi:hypothetical protein